MKDYLLPAMFERWCHANNVPFSQSTEAHICRFLQELTEKIAK